MGNRLAPARFVLFASLFLVAAPAAGFWFERPWFGIMVGFDIAAFAFLLSCLPLLRVRDHREMRRDALANDANRPVLLAITVAAMLVVLITIGIQIIDDGTTRAGVKETVIVTLLLGWLFANSVYTLHYAHLAYMIGTEEGSAGLEFPGTRHPVYSDFAYFAFTLGMTFQTSDVEISDRAIRNTVTWHSLAAFVFNIGVLAFTINVLGSSAI